MRIFSILQQAIWLEFPEADRVPPYRQAIEFGQDPDDSSIVRMRVGPIIRADEPEPYGMAAIEIEFDRNGRLRSQRLWPLKYAAWDKREPAVIDAEIAKQSSETIADEVGEPDTATSPVPQSKFFKRK